MIILLPWKPVVILRPLLSAMLWCGYVGSSLMEGKNPFAPYAVREPHTRHFVREVRYRTYSQKCRSCFPAG